jgi:hypothetical protein
MLANAQKEIAALNEKAAEERAGRADNLLKALLSAKGEVVICSLRRHQNTCDKQVVPRVQ